MLEAVLLGVALGLVGLAVCLALKLGYDTGRDDTIRAVKLEKMRALVPRG